LRFYTAEERPARAETLAVGTGLDLTEIERIRQPDASLVSAHCARAFGLELWSFGLAAAAADRTTPWPSASPERA